MPSRFSAGVSSCFRAPPPHTLPFVSSLRFPLHGSWPVHACVVPHSFLLREHPACPRFLCRAKCLPRGILPSNHTISSHQLWLQTTVTAQHWHKERNSTFLTPCSGEPASQRKVKLCFHSGAVLHSPSTWNMWGMMWGTNQNSLAKALMRSLQFGVFAVSHTQSPALAIKSWELVPALPVYHSPRIWLFRRAWSREWPVLEAAQESTGVGNTCHLVCPRHFSSGRGIQRGGFFMAKWNFLLPMLT